MPVFVVVGFSPARRAPTGHLLEVGVRIALEERVRRLGLVLGYCLTEQRAAGGHGAKIAFLSG